MPSSTSPCSVPAGVSMTEAVMPDTFARLLTFASSESAAQQLESPWALADTHLPWLPHWASWLWSWAAAELPPLRWPLLSGSRVDVDGVDRFGADVAGDECAAGALSAGRGAG